MEEELTKLLPELVQAVRDASPEVWEILIRQSYVMGSVSVITWLATFGLLVVAVRYHKSEEQARRSYDDDDVLSMGMALVAAGAMIVSSLFLFLDGIPRLLNPAYYALQALLP